MGASDKSVSSTWCYSFKCVFSEFSEANFVHSEMERHHMYRLMNFNEVYAAV